MVKHTLNPIAPIKKQLLLLITVLSCYLFSGGLIAEPIASIDRSVIAKDDTLIFTIRSYKNNSIAPDLSPLEKNFFVVGNNQSSRYVTRNGLSESWTEWKISLIPKRLGHLNIPSIRVNGEITQTLSVNVQPSIPVTTGQMRAVYIESEIDNDSVYVQQQIIYTLRIFQSIQLDNMNISEPEFDNAIMEKMGQNSFQRRIQNTPYRVHELRYAIYPQESGELIIPEMVFSASQVSSQRSIFNLPGQGKLIRKTSEQHTIKVLEPAAGMGNALWLPAQLIKISETWSASPDEIHVGDSITRSVTISAEGLLDSQLPLTVFIKPDNTNMYPDQGKTATNAEGITAISSRTDSVAIIPTKAGSLVLPEIRLKWWNTNKNQQQEVVIPQQTLVVKPAAINTQGISTPLAVDHSGTSAAKADLPDTTQQVDSNNWKITTLLFATLWLITLLMWWRRKAVKPETNSNQKIKHTNINEKNEFKNLAAVCKTRDLSNIRMAIISWGQSYWPEKNIQSLEDVAHLCRQESFENEINKLNTHLYSVGSSLQWQGTALLSAVDEFRKNNTRGKSVV